MKKLIVLLLYLCIAMLTTYLHIQAGFADSNLPTAKVHPAQFEEAAKRACETKLVDAKHIYPHVDEANLPFLCMDLVYQYTLLVEGFGRLQSQFSYLCKFMMIFCPKNPRLTFHFFFFFFFFFCIGLDPWQEITLVKKVKYQDALVEAAWPLGSAIEAVSSLK